MFLECWNSFTESNVVRRPFQTNGAEAEKARRVNSVRVLGTTSLGSSVDRTERVLMCRCSSESRYGGVDVVCTLWARSATFKSMRFRTDNLCSDCSSGLDRVWRVDWVTTRARVFWVRCLLSMVVEKSLW